MREVLIRVEAAAPCLVGGAAVAGAITLRERLKGKGSETAVAAYHPPQPLVLQW